MNSYEKKIGFKTIIQSFVRRWKSIVLVFVPISFVTLIITQFFISKQYGSSFTFSNSANFDSASYNTAVSYIKKEETINAVIDNLAHYDDPIILSYNQLSDGLSIPAWKSVSPYITVTFSFSNKNIVQQVAKEISKVSLPAIQSKFSNVFVYSDASLPTKTSKDTTYLLIGLAVGAVLALGFAFIDEIISDEVYDKEDVEYLGSPTFEITASK